MKQFDVLIIGAGVVGNAIAREISKKSQVTVGVLEKEPDTAFGVSGRNSGVLHAGFNNKPGSLMAKLCVEGSVGFEKEASELGVDFKKTGKLVIARFEEDLPRLQRLREQGDANSVRELRIIGRDELGELAGYDAGAGALWSGMTGIFDPFQFTVALAEAAAALGANYFFGRKVIGVTTHNLGDVVPQADPESQRDSRTGGFLVTAENLVTGQEECYQCRILINSAGLFADEICRMAGIHDYKIYPCRGEYHILDKKQRGLLSIPIYPIPNDKEGGLGAHLTPAISGNILIGPSAEYLTDGQEREEYGTTRDVMDQLTEEGYGLFPELDGKDRIRSFAGIRPKLVPEAEGGYADFVIEESRQVPGFIQLVGIESPGMTASIPIAKMVARMTDEIRSRGGEENKDTGRQLETDEAATPDVSVAGLKATSASFGEQGDQKMLCRCEGITEAAILEAFDRILLIGAVPTVKGLKNRTRVTMGSCQGSFCTINIIELLQKKRNVDPLGLLWNGFGSRMLAGRVRE